MTYEDFRDAVRKDKLDHPVKALASLFLAAMIDWPVTLSIDAFIQELKAFFGEPLTIDDFKNKAFSYEKKHDLWRFEARASIVMMLELSLKSQGESDFDKVVESILEYYQK